MLYITRVKMKQIIFLVIFIRLVGFNNQIIRLNVDDISYYTDVYPDQGYYYTEITLNGGKTLQVKDNPDEVDLLIANSLLKEKIK